LQNNQFKPVQQSRQEDQKNIVDQKQIDITAVFQPAAKASYSAGLNLPLPSPYKRIRVPGSAEFSSYSDTIKSPEFLQIKNEQFK